MKATCERCGKYRSLKHCTGPALHPKGEDICRPCFSIIKLSTKLHPEKELPREKISNHSNSNT